MTTVTTSEHDAETLLTSFLVACWAEPRKAFPALNLADPGMAPTPELGAVIRFMQRSPLDPIRAALGAGDERTVTLLESIEDTAEEVKGEAVAGYVDRVIEELTRAGRPGGPDLNANDLWAAIASAAPPKVELSGVPEHDLVEEDDTELLAFLCACLAEPQHARDLIGDVAPTTAVTPVLGRVIGYMHRSVRDPLGAAGSDVEAAELIGQMAILAYAVNAPISKPGLRRMMTRALTTAHARNGGGA